MGAVTGRAHLRVELADEADEQVAVDAAEEAHLIGVEATLLSP
jgi:hypothetical protein